ncbi:MAG: hypothetical protein LBL39_00840, partial [Planctomycetaceae bacterium]|nr:hypothetical protein [Planctomycetaceae bacterium]
MSVIDFYFSFVVPDYSGRKQFLGEENMGERVYISFDYAVKRLLRKKSDYEVLEGFLSEVLAKDISIKNLGESESNKENAEDK